MHVATPVFAAALLATSPALAQDRPPAFPTRDVAVTYRTAGGDEMRIAWHAGEQRMRMDMPGGRGAMVLDIKGRRAFMVMDAQRTVMELPVGEDMEQAGRIPDEARLTREGADRVAGHPCTVWRMEHEGERGTACITADGVMLRARGADGAQQMEAVQVTYAPQDAARFRPPAGYRSMQMPQGAPPGDGAGGATPSPPPSHGR